MIPRAIAFAAAVVVAGYAEAQTIVTRSGEHDDFTRLVMRIPDGVEWSLTQSDRIATVNLGSPTAVFNTRGIFDLIPRTRIQTVSQNGPGQPLRIELGCECVVDYYQQADGYLVLDVREGRPLALAEPSDPASLPLTFPVRNNSFSFNLGRQDLASARVAMDLEDAVEATFGSSQQRPSQTGPIELPLLMQSEARTLGDVSAEGDTKQVAEAQPKEPKPTKSEDGKSEPEAIGADASLLMDFDENRRAAMVNDSESRLLQQIGRASEQGLLKTTEESGENSQLNPRGNQNRPLNPLDNISVTSAIDRETGLLAIGGDGDSEDTHCIQDREVAIHKWGGEAAFAEQIGALRSKMLGEFDQVDRNVVLKLARTYLYFGFGAEARATMRMIPEDRFDETSREIMMTMGSIVDAADLPVNTIFTGQQTCGGDSAFWAAMADGVVKKSANTDAIQQAFAKLPPHLRVQLGPRMSTLFATAGDPHVAKAALRAVDRTGIETVPDRNLAEAAIAELEGNTEAVARNLTEEVAEQSENTPMALIELINLSFRERRALSPDVPDLTASYELESRDTALGAELRLAEVTALALAGRFDEAFSRFDKLERRDGIGARNSVNAPLMILLTENANDVTFLKYALIFAEEAGATRAGQVGDLVAERLLDLGFPQQAETLLRKMSLEPDNENRRMMSAEALLAMDQPQRALVELMGLEGEQADRMRARALWRNKEYERASEYMMSAQDLNAAARGFWHSENLESAESLDTEVAPFRAVADLTNQIDTAVREPEGLPPLAEARALLESSAGARSSIEELLRRVERTPPEE
ncbi:hypothetical protein [Tritonibacter horizontis]|uniref:Tetratricopeptide repeat protein n=1 Tax=Tritonibacter horizontis TaxID=1768241 RepID=A0A132C280_9RHOB|nr:hypothetical protein [Tritonibacter horizontis]KUP94765.1 hypothetical protein TRIHO_00980 [Tritonibacter horizontis]